MKLEIENLRTGSRADIPVPGGRTLVTEVRGKSPSLALQEIIDTWTIVAHWGMMDDDDVHFPSDEACMECLPSWCSDALISKGLVRNFCENAFEREWIWYSGAVVGNVIKVDIDTFACPIGTFTIVFLLELVCNAPCDLHDWLPGNQVTV